MERSRFAVRIRCSTWRFQLAMSRLQLVLGLLPLRIWLLALVLRIRPGLAPELSHRTRCPWLSRTAGRPIYRPVPWDAFRARMQAATAQVGEAFLRGLTPAVHAAGRAIQKFGEDLTVLLAAEARRAAEDTAGRVGL